MPITTIVEDQDPSIKYIGRWQAIKSTTASNGTLHATWAAGSRVIVKFKGSSISVFGSLERGAANTPTAAVCIDESEAQILKGEASEEDTLPMQKLYGSPELDANEEHTLLITVTEVVKRGSAFYIDYFHVVREEPMVPDGPSQSNNPANITASILTQSASLTSSSAGSNATITAQSNLSSSSRSKSTTIGIAVGSAMSSLLLIFMVLTLVCLLRQKRKNIASSRRARAFSSTIDSQDVSTSRALSERQEPGFGFIIRGGHSKEKAANRPSYERQPSNHQNSGNLFESEPLPVYQSDFGGH